MLIPPNLIYRNKKTDTHNIRPNKRRSKTAVIYRGTCTLTVRADNSACFTQNIIPPVYGFVKHFFRKSDFFEIFFQIHIKIYCPDYDIVTKL